MKHRRFRFGLTLALSAIAVMLGSVVAAPAVLGHPTGQQISDSMSSSQYVVSRTLTSQVVDQGIGLDISLPNDLIAEIPAELQPITVIEIYQRDTLSESERVKIEIAVERLPDDLSYAQWQEIQAGIGRAYDSRVTSVRPITVAGQSGEFREVSVPEFGLIWETEVMVHQVVYRVSMMYSPLGSGLYKSVLEGLKFTNDVRLAPNFISKSTLGLDRSNSSTNSPSGFPDLKFPFDGKHKITCAYHADNPGCHEKSLIALDFDLNYQTVKAAHDGTLSRSYDTCTGLNAIIVDQSDSSYKTLYLHLSSYRGSEGDVDQGDEIGVSGVPAASGCGRGAHLHFQLQHNGSAVGNNVKPEPMCGQTGFVAGQQVTSCWDNVDQFPPTITFTSYPALNTWYNTSQRVDWSVSDSSGIWGFSQAWDVPPSGPPPQFPGAIVGWLDLTNLSQGQHTVRVRAWDNSSNHNEASAQRGWFGYDTLAPLNPSAVTSGCAASNNVWQNTCTDPNFTWSGASDGNGSGVKDYRYYWGLAVNGSPITYTSATNFDPPPVPGSVATRFLRLSTRDNLSQESLPSTMFVFLYDASSPTTTVQINRGATSANQVNVILNLTASDNGSGVRDVRLSNNGVDWTNWQPFAAELPWTLPALNRRSVTVYAQVRDRAGNPSGGASASIYLDLYPVMPSSANYRICQDVMNVGGSTHITSPNYWLASAIGQPMATGAISNTSASFNSQSGFLANLTGCLPITYTATSNYSLTQWVVASGGNIRGSVSYRLGDTAGQPSASGAAVFSSTNYRMSSGFWAAITVTIPPTTTPPTLVPTRTPTPTPTPGPTPTPQPETFSMVVNDDASYTNQSVVSVRAGGPNVTQMMLSNDSSFANVSWLNYQLDSTWILSTYGNISLPSFVFARFRDAENTEYGTYFDSIIYDPVPPQGNVSILGGEVQTVTLWLEGWDDYSGVADMHISEDPQTLDSSAWLAYTNTVEWPLIGNIVYAQFRDGAGNLSPIYTSDGTVFDPNAKKVYLPLVVK